MLPRSVNNFLLRLEPYQLFSHTVSDLCTYNNVECNIWERLKLVKFEGLFSLCSSPHDTPPIFSKTQVYFSLSNKVCTISILISLIIYRILNKRFWTSTAKIVQIGYTHFDESDWLSLLFLRVSILYFIFLCYVTPFLTCKYSCTFWHFTWLNFDIHP